MTNSKSFNIVTSVMTSLATIAILSVTAVNAYVPIAIQTSKQNQVAQYQIPASVINAAGECIRRNCPETAASAVRTIGNFRDWHNRQQELNRALRMMQMQQSNGRLTIQQSPTELQQRQRRVVCLTVNNCSYR